MRLRICQAVVGWMREVTYLTDCRWPDERDVVTVRQLLADMEDKWGGVKTLLFVKQNSKKSDEKTVFRICLKKREPF